MAIPKLLEKSRNAVAMNQYNDGAIFAEQFSANDANATSENQINIVKDEGIDLLPTYANILHNNAFSDHWKTGTYADSSGEMYAYCDDGDSYAGAFTSFLDAPPAFQAYDGNTGDNAILSPNELTVSAGQYTASLTSDRLLIAMGNANAEMCIIDEELGGSIRVNNSFEDECVIAPNALFLQYGDHANSIVLRSSNAGIGPGLQVINPNDHSADYSIYPSGGSILFFNGDSDLINIIAAEPTSSSHLTTKNYVDTSINNAIISALTANY